MALTAVDKPVPNQSYLVKQMQIRMASALAVLAHDLGAYTTVGRWDQPGSNILTPNGWRKNKQNFNLKGEDCVISFSNVRWDPENSKMDYGPKTVAQNVEENDETKTKIIENDTDTELHVAYEESVELTNSFRTDVTKGVTLDMSLEVASEQKVSGSYAGVSAEVSLSEKFGIAKGQSREEEQEEAREGTKSESLAIEFDAAARQYYMVSILKEHATTYQPVNIDGIQDFDIHVDCGERWKYLRPQLQVPATTGLQHPRYQWAATVP